MRLSEVERYYSSTIGRFLTPVPYDGSVALKDPQSWNRYIYAHDDPANQNDPSGLRPLIIPTWDVEWGWVPTEPPPFWEYPDPPAPPPSEPPGIGGEGGGSASDALLVVKNLSKEGNNLISLI